MLLSLDSKDWALIVTGVATVMIPQVTLIILALINRVKINRVDAKADAAVETVKTVNAKADAVVETVRAVVGTVAQVDTKLTSVHDQINGMQAKLLETTERAAQAEGKEQGRAEGKETEKQDREGKKDGK